MLPIVLAVRFALELVLLAVFFAGGYHIGGGGLLGVLVGVLVAGVVAVGWGVFLSPKARVPLTPAIRSALEVLVFLVAAAVLFALGRPGWAIILVVADVGVLLALSVLGRAVPDSGGPD